MEGAREWSGAAASHLGCHPRSTRGVHGGGDQALDPWSHGSFKTEVVQCLGEDGKNRPGRGSDGWSGVW